jgi:hypothetical protein
MERVSPSSLTKATKGVRVDLSATWEVRTGFGDLGQLAAFLESFTLYCARKTWAKLGICSDALLYI